MENIFTRPALVRDSFRIVRYGDRQYGYSFRFNTTDTRATYLSCLEDFTVELDGKAVSPYDMTIRVGAGEYLVSLLPELHSVILGLGETATVKVRCYENLQGTHTLTLRYRGRVPFIGSAAHSLAAPTADEMTVSEGRQKDE